jgi:DNA polymerase-1
MIQSHGPFSAPFFLIADGGGPQDELTNYALSGYAEQTLTQLMNDTIHFKDAWKTCLIKERINAADTNSYINKVSEYSNFLIEEINEIKPFLLIPLNEVSFNFLTGLNNIRKFRGSVLETTPKLSLFKRLKVLPILGPNPFLYQEYSLRWITQIDFLKVHRFLNYDPPPEQKLNIWVAKNTSALSNFLERSYSSSKFLVFDIETYLGIPICISLCFDGMESVCVPFLDLSIPIEERIGMIQLVARVLKSNIPKVNQNIKFDIKCLERFNFIVNNVAGDTMINAAIINPELPKNLGFLNSIYTDIPYFKDEGKYHNPEKFGKNTYYLYNAKDSLATWRIYEKQEEEIKEIGSNYVADRMSKLILIYKDMENNGLWYDDEKRKLLVNKYTSLYEIQLTKLSSLIGKRINPLSPKQCAHLIYNELGYTKSKQIKGTSEEELESLMVFGNPKAAPITGRNVLQIIINCRKIQKILEYLNIIPYPDNKFRCEYNLVGTETGRTTAGKTTDVLLVWEELKTKKHIIGKQMGRSFQTIGKHGFMIDGETYGKDIRSIFVPSRGYSFVEIDLSQAEARVDAVLSGNFNILNIFDGSVGIHRLTGSWVFNCPPEEIKKNIVVLDQKTGISCDRYLMSKTVRHAGERNMKAARLSMMTQQPLKICDNILKIFHSKQPEIKEVFHREVEECIKRDRILISPNGRRRQFLDRIDQHLINEAISQLPQSVVSDQVKFSFIPTFESAGWATLIIEQHDGFLSEVPTGREEEFYIIAKSNLEKPIDFRNCSLKRDYNLIIPSEVSISTENWYNLKEVKF